MSDHDIRTLLHAMAEEVQDVRPLAHVAVRRTRTRRWALATTVVASVMTVAVVGAGLALDAGAIGADPLTTPAGSPEGTPPPPRPMQGTLVAHGTSEAGSEWWLSAYKNDAGELCVDMQHDDGREAEDCGPYEPEDGGFYSDDGGGATEPSAFGWVSDTTENLWVTFGDRHGLDFAEETPEDEAPEDEEAEDEGPADEGQGESSGGGEPGPNIDVSIEGDERVALYDAPDGFPFPVRFYALVPAPPNAEALHIALRNGDATVLIVSFPGDDQGADPPVDRDELVAEGEHDGHSWELYARTNGDERCLDILWADEQYGSGGGCSTAVPRAESFQYSMIRFSDDKGIAFYAALTKEVATLEMTLENGETIALDIIEGSPGSDVDYAVEWPPLDADGVVRGTVTSRDDAGDVLDTMELCELAAPNSACASDSPPP